VEVFIRIRANGTRPGEHHEKLRLLRIDLAAVLSSSPKIRRCRFFFEIFYDQRLRLKNRRGRGGARLPGSRFALEVQLWNKLRLYLQW